ncbi:hypothetical protein PMAYCL1PPCAC_19674, partial [Pristionchus mayeri]
IFWHMFFVLKNQTSSSESTKVLIRLSLIRLFMQLNVPFLFIVLPLIVTFLQAALRIFPFLVVVYVIKIIPLHPIAHNFVLLFLMPTYRRVITNAIR